jgi:hypothetical protein
MGLRPAVPGDPRFRNVAEAAPLAGPLLAARSGSDKLA